MVNVYFEIVLVLALSTLIKCQNSPCPSAFSYNGYGGRVVLANHGFQPGDTIKLMIILSVPAQLQSGFVGKIDLIGSEQTVFNAVAYGNPIEYQVTFPPNVPTPNVVSISVNGGQICVGPPASGNFVTKITLDHKLDTYLNSPGGGGGGGNGRPQIVKPVNNFIQPQPQPIPQRPIEYRPLPPSTTRQPITIPPTRKTTPQIHYHNEYNSNNAHTASNECGIEGQTIVSLSINAEKARRGQYPWLVALFLKVGQGELKFYCGSSLISKKSLITAAHCLYNDDQSPLIPKQITASVGRYNINDPAEDGSVYKSISKLVPHPDYGVVEGSFDADIAVIILTSSIEYTTYIRPICLWPSKQSSSNDVSNQLGRVSGWGTTETGETSDITLFFKAKIVDRKTCLQEDPLYLQSTSSRSFCAGGDGSAKNSGPCTGDSGGGFVIKQNDRWYLRGVVSHSLIDSATYLCDVKKYAIYTDAAQFIDWILPYM